MVVTMYVDITIEKAEITEGIVKMQGTILFKDKNKTVKWRAQHRASGWRIEYKEFLIDEVKKELKGLITGMMGYVNIPYKRTMTIQVG